MTQHRIQVIFQPDGARAQVIPGSILIDVMATAGIAVARPCGGLGLCGKCRVQIHGFSSTPRDRDKRFFSAQELKEGWRLACGLEVTHPMTVTTPPESRVGAQSILTDSLKWSVPLAPSVHKAFHTLPHPTLEDPRSDQERLLSALAEDESQKFMNTAVLRSLPEVLRQGGYAVTVVSDNDGVMALEEGDTTKRLYGAAFDLGTTTAVGLLFDLRTGARLATAARGNPQTAYGDDVIARIQKCGEDRNALADMSRMVVACFNDILEELEVKSGQSSRYIYEIVVAGNTAMTHLFLGVPPVGLSRSPFTSAFQRIQRISARELGLAIHPQGSVCTMPCVAGFVGGDTAAATLASRIWANDDLTLLIDLGTNGEIVLGNKQRILACSTAAGPAFEGARIRQGMRATAGAIDRVFIKDGKLSVHVICEEAARGLCGTGLIDAAAILLREGVIDMGGRILSPDDMGPDVLPDLKRRTTKGEVGFQVAICDEKESPAGRPVYLTQSDVRELQLAKAAIVAGIDMLTHRVGIEIRDIDRVMLAGVFGNYIDPDSAERIGLLAGLPTKRVMSIGNAAGAGAGMALLSMEARRQAQSLALRMEHVELSILPEFQEAFMEHILFDPLY